MTVLKPGGKREVSYWTQEKKMIAHTWGLIFFPSNQMEMMKDVDEQRKMERWPQVIRTLNYWTKNAVIDENSPNLSAKHYKSSSPFTQSLGWHF